MLVPVMLLRINIVNDETNKRRAPIGDLVAVSLEIAELDGVYEPFYQVPIVPEREYLSELKNCAKEWWVRLVSEPNFNQN